MILDTNAVSAILSGEPLIQLRFRPGEPQHLPIVVIGEYQFGILGSKYRENLQHALDRLESNSIILHCDRTTADTYAVIRHDLKQRGTPIPENDLWIAALARQHQLEIVSRDPHFDHVEGIGRIDWSKIGIKGSPSPERWRIESIAEWPESGCSPSQVDARLELI